ncbi:hypothetical protein BJV82DRAFT_579793 [Fennellomyces sp. T-0311]|nr:hypothetical protein BJV82DRAFT_579793 [Fennellomyces sp. T-0311]
MLYKEIEITYVVNADSIVILHSRHNDRKSTVKKQIGAIPIRRISFKNIGNFEAMYFPSIGIFEGRKKLSYCRQLHSDGILKILAYLGGRPERHVFQNVNSVCGTFSDSWEYIYLLQSKWTSLAVNSSNDGFGIFNPGTGGSGIHSNSTGVDT